MVRDSLPVIKDSFRNFGDSFHLGYLRPKQLFIDVWA